MNDSSQPDDRRTKTLEAIFEEAVDAIVTIDVKGTIESFNPATLDLFGYASDELLGQNINLLMPNPYRDAHDTYIKNYLDSGIRKIIGIGREVVGRRKDGSVFPIHLAVSEIKVGQSRLFAGVIRDLTEFKRLEQSQTTLGRIVEDSLNEVYLFDVQTLKFCQVNLGARKNLGYDLEELRGMTPMDIKPGFTEETFRSTIEPLLTGEQKRLQFETQHVRKDGTRYDVDVHLQLSKYHGEPALVAIILDVTERRRAEREIEKHREAMQAELERLVETRTAELHEAQAELVRSEKFSTLGKVAGGIAHEIRNPLNAVKTSAYYLLNAKNASPDKVKEHLERIDRQVTTIDSVVTALSDVAKLPAANLREVTLEPIVRNAVSSTGLPENIQVRYEFPDELPAVMVDSTQIVIAIKNVIRNARDAMPDGGTLKIVAVDAGNQIQVSFYDTGIGIDPALLDKILEPLFTTKARGMGLGLSITRAIAEKNQCTLQIESELGVGSNFTIGLVSAGSR